MPGSPLPCPVSRVSLRSASNDAEREDRINRDICWAHVERIARNRVDFPHSPRASPRQPPRSINLRVLRKIIPYECRTHLCPSRPIRFKSHSPTDGGAQTLNHQIDPPISTHRSSDYVRPPNSAFDLPAFSTPHLRPLRRRRNVNAPAQSAPPRSSFKRRAPASRSAPLSRAFTKSSVDVRPSNESPAAVEDRPARSNFLLGSLELGPLTVPAYPGESNGPE